MLYGTGEHTFPISYVAFYPVHRIDFNRSPRPERTEWRLKLAENIEANGLVNPLIVLNHRTGPRGKCRDNWLMVGTNRLWAIRHLGWTTVPVITTGPCPFDNVPIESWDQLRSYFRDGEPYLSAYGIALKNTIPPETCKYPICPHL